MRYSFFYTYVWFLDGIPIYVGKGKEGRWHQHLNTDTPHSHKLQKARQESKDLQCKLYPQPSQQAALECEIKLIAKYGRRDLGKGPLFNLTDGGNKNPSAKTRAKMSATKKID